MAEPTPTAEPTRQTFRIADKVEDYVEYYIPYQIHSTGERRWETYRKIITITRHVDEKGNEVYTTIDDELSQRLPEEIFSDVTKQREKFSGLSEAGKELARETWAENHFSFEYSVLFRQDYLSAVFTKRKREMMEEEEVNFSDEMTAYYDAERKALDDNVKAGHLEEKKAVNGTLYVMPLSTGDELPVALSRPHIIIRIGDLVDFKRDKPDGGHWEARMKVGDLEIDKGNGAIKFRRESGSDTSSLRIQDARVNLSAIARMQRVQAKTKF